MKKTSSLFAALALTSVSTICAAEGVYIFGSVGQSDLEAPDATSTASVTDDTDTTFTLGLGYQFNDHFSLEAGYTDLGETDININGPATLNANGATVDGSATIDVSGYFVGLKGEAPVSESFSVFARAGAYIWESDFDGSGTNVEIADGTDAYLALGTAYSVTENVAVDFQVSRYNLDDTDVDTYTLGLTYKFK